MKPTRKIKEKTVNTVTQVVASMDPLGRLVAGVVLAALVLVLLLVVGLLLV
jgi:CHASE3 domain sensor protein